MGTLLAMSESPTSPPRACALDPSSPAPVLPDPTSPAPTSPAPRAPRLGRLGFRVLLAFLVVALVPLVVVSLGAQQQGREVVERFLAENAANTAQIWAADLDVFLEQQRILLRSVPVGADPAGLSELLFRTTRQDPSLESLLLVDGSGQVLAASAPVPAVPAWVQEACTALVTEPDRAMTHAGAGHAHEVVVGVPGPDGQGVLCGQVSFTLHQQMLSERASSVAGGSAYIVDRSGQIVCYAFEEGEAHHARGEHLDGIAAQVAVAGLPWSGLVQGEAGPSFAAYASARTLPWGVWVEVPREVAAASLRPFLRHTALYALGFGLVVALVALVLSRHLLGPLAEVSAAARAIAADRPGKTVDVRGDDEIASLATEFNRMSVALGRSYDELDARVAARTGEIRQLHARLLHQEKMAAIGALAAGLAHEIGNPLASMSSELEMLERLWDPQEARDSLPVLREQIERISRLLHELVDFGRRPSDAVEALPAREVLEQAARLLRHDPRSRGVALDLDLPAEPIVLRSSRDGLLQVLVNLGLNALDALSGQGSLRLSLSRDPSGEVRLTVQDDGPGIPAELRGQVFDPFFTTKAPGVGTGLGLFVSERIVDQLGGRLELHSEPGQGSRFDMVLPAPDPRDET